MYQFQVAIRALPADLAPGPVVQLESVSVRPREVASTQLDLPLPVSFEATCEQLSSWPRMFIEPDGAFVWTAGQRDDPTSSYWQLDGCLFDRRGSLLVVEARGCCPPQACNELLTVLGWPATPLLFEMSSLGMFVLEEDFRKLATAGIGRGPQDE